MSYAPPEPDVRRLLRPSALPGFVGRLCTTIALLAAGFAGLGFLYDAQSTGLGKLQVNESVTNFIIELALVAARLGFCIALMVEATLYLFLRSGASWRTILWAAPLGWSAVGAWLVWMALRLEELDVVPKIVMLMVGGGVVLYLTVSMQATLWQASFGVAPEVNDFPFVWYLTLVMMMSAFFGGFRGWTDVSPMVKRVIEYRDKNWARERPADLGRPALEGWIQ